MRYFLCLYLLLLAAGCVRRIYPNSELDGRGFLHPTLPYRVDFTDAAQQRVLDADWRLDNFYMGRGGQWLAKRGEGYVERVEFDTNGDGLGDGARYFPYYDLLLEHVRTDQRMWLRTLVLSQSDEHKRLEVIARAYVDRVASAGYTLVSMHDKRVVVVENKYAIEVIGAKYLDLGGREAYAVAADIANMGLQGAAHMGGQTRVLLVFVRTGYTESVKRVDFPSILLAGYASVPADFDTGLSAFRQLLSRVGLQQRRATQDELQEGSAWLIGTRQMLVPPDDAFDFAQRMTGLAPATGADASSPSTPAGPAPAAPATPAAP